MVWELKFTPKNENKSWVKDIFYLKLDQNQALRAVITEKVPISDSSYSHDLNS